MLTGTPSPNATGNRPSATPSAANGQSPPTKAQSTIRTKRAKYASAACCHCKKRKLKCLPASSTGPCRRCIDTGKPCSYTTIERSVRHAPVSKLATYPEDDLQSLTKKVATLQRELSLLGGAISDMQSRNRDDHCQRLTSTKRELPTRYEHEPVFAGPTRFTSSMDIGEQSLTRLGIPTYGTAKTDRDDHQVSAPLPQSEGALDSASFWQQCTVDEVERLIQIFEEEVGIVYPCMESSTFMLHASRIIDWGSRFDSDVGVLESDAGANREMQSGGFGITDFFLAKVAIATAIIADKDGIDSRRSTIMMESVERSVSRILKPAGTLKDLQLLVALSIYYFYCGEDISAWRTIGLAAREALIMGLHQRASLMKAYPDHDERCLATRIFWCIYVLDRRWSFGASLSFALVDADIDPALPEPGPDYEYLQCMVGYGRLCSNVWTAVVSFNTTPASLEQDKIQLLDGQVLSWLKSIPTLLQLEHPRQGTAPRPQPVILHRLRALLYLRGNYMRMLVYRHSLLSPSRIRMHPQSAWLAIEIAQDSIEVLVHLNSTSNIYRRQQLVFSYFLLSAFAVVFLAICHNPEAYAERCQESFNAALALVQAFSSRGQASKHLWERIYDLSLRLQTLARRNLEEPTIALKSRQSGQNHGDVDFVMLYNSGDMERGRSCSQVDVYDSADGHAFQQCSAQGINGEIGTLSDTSSVAPDTLHISDDLVDLFYAIEQGSLASQ